MAGDNWSERTEETSLIWRLIGVALLLISAFLAGWLFAHAANYLSWVITR